MKCKCINVSKWYLIDDSFKKNSNVDGGEFSFVVGEIYEYEFIKHGMGDYYDVKINKTSVGFDEIKFNLTFTLGN